MDRDNARMVERLTEEYGSWFLRDDRLAQGRLSGRLHPFEQLFSPIPINGITLKNRIVMGPMGNLSVAEESGRPSDRMVRYFAERARGGAGLDDVWPDPRQPEGRPRGHRARRSLLLSARWTARAASSPAGATLPPPATPPAPGSSYSSRPGWAESVRPSVCLASTGCRCRHRGTRTSTCPAVPCRPLLGRACRRIMKAAGQAAADAKAMQIDGVYLHGHEGYLLDQLTSPAFNRRRRGRYADWQRFGLDLVGEIRRRTGEHYPIMYRIDFTTAPRRDLRRAPQDGRLAAALRQRANRGDDAGLHGQSRRGGGGRVRRRPGLLRQLVAAAPSDLHAARLLPRRSPHRPRLSARARASCPTPACEVPIAAVGKLGNPDVCEQALRDGVCDMVMLARPLLADPEWPAKAYSGRIGEIVPCIGDQEGCVNELTSRAAICSAPVNPRAGFEDVFERELPAGGAPAAHRRGGRRPERHRLRLRRRAVAATRSRCFEARGPARRHAGARLRPARETGRGQLPRVPGRAARARCTGARHGAALGQPGVGGQLEREAFDAVVICAGAELTPTSGRRHRPPARGVGDRPAAAARPRRRRPAGRRGRRRGGRLRSRLLARRQSTPSR